MDFVKYLREVNAQRQINRLAKKYREKKVVLYGAGLYAKVILEKYDCSKLNIVAICDKKFGEKEDSFLGYKTISPETLTEYDCDVILVSVIEDSAIRNYLEEELLVGTKNEELDVKSFIEPTLFYCIKTLIWG